MENEWIWFWEVASQTSPPAQFLLSQAYPLISGDTFIVKDPKLRAELVSLDIDQFW